MTTLDVGDHVFAKKLVYDDTKTLVDATVALSVTDPAGAVTSPSVTHASTGTYTATFTLASAGVWTYKWSISGTVVEVESLQVTATNPAPPTYASLALLKQDLGLASTNVSDDELLTLALTTASRAVEKYCDDRVFNLDTTATARNYEVSTHTVTSGRRGDRVNVDDIGSATGLVVELSTDGVGYTTIASAQYSVWPDNALATDQPITGILFRLLSLWGYTDVRITARWGWPQVPDEVVTATLRQAGRLYKRKDSPQGVMGNTEWGLIRVPYLDPDVKALLAPYASVFQAA